MMIISAEIFVLLLFVIWGSFKFPLRIRYFLVTGRKLRQFSCKCTSFRNCLHCVCELASKIIQILLHVDPPSLTYSDKSEEKFIVHTEPERVKIYCIFLV